METLVLLSALGLVLSSFTKNNQDISSADSAVLLQLQKDIAAMRAAKERDLRTAGIAAENNDVLLNPFTRPEKLDPHLRSGTSDASLPMDLRPIVTRGTPPGFRYVGNAIDANNRILKLFGRPKYRGSTQFEYYGIYSDAHDSTKIPLDNLTKEVFDGDSIKVPFLSNDEFRVNIFKDRTFEYYPDYI